jgi:drug/metabolite transporter (DMT)-like permease
MSNRAKGAFLTTFGGACWGISGCTGQYLFTRQGMETTWLVPIRLFLAGVLLCLYYLGRNPKQLVAPWKTRQDAVDLLIYGLAGVSGCQFLYFLTIQLSSAGMATILQDLSPALILAITCLMAHRAPRLPELGSIALALIGVFLLTTHGSLTQLVISPAALGAGLLSAVCVVIYTMWPRRLQQRYPTPMLQGWAFLLGGTLFLLLLQPWKSAYRPNAIGLVGIAIVVLVGNILAFSCYMQGVKLIGPQRASLYSFAEPVVAALISTSLLGSSFTPWDAMGFLCIFLMLVLLSLPQKKAPAESAEGIK